MNANNGLNAVGENLLGQPRVLLCQLRHVIQAARLPRERWGERKGEWEQTRESDGWISRLKARHLGIPAV